MLYDASLVNDVKISGFSRVTYAQNDLRGWEKQKRATNA